MTYPMTHEKFDSLKQVLCSQQGLTVRVMSDNSGQLENNQVELGYAFDPTAGELAVTIIKKKGLAKLASDETVFQRVGALLGIPS